jgi:hypothetical protein
MGNKNRNKSPIILNIDAKVDDKGNPCLMCENGACPTDLFGVENGTNKDQSVSPKGSSQLPPRNKPPALPNLSKVEKKSGNVIELPHELSG